MLGSMNLNQYSESSAQPGLSVSKLLLLEVSIPPPVEQNAIAAVLSDMDSELQALNNQIEKARRVKAGMMQDLLAGSVRLL